MNKVGRILILQRADHDWSSITSLGIQEKAPAADKFSEFDSKMSQIPGPAQWVGC